jgi:hypothetical protein
MDPQNLKAFLRESKFSEIFEKNDEHLQCEWVAYTIESSKVRKADNPISFKQRYKKTIIIVTGRLFAASIV